MMVGPSGSGKSTAWRVLLKALERFEGVEGVAHVIDPKAISKEALYGVLDPNTREWTDGLFTHILRQALPHFASLSRTNWSNFQKNHRQCKRRNQQAPVDYLRWRRGSRVGGEFKFRSG